LTVHLFKDDRERIDEQGWKRKLEQEPYKKAGRAWVLNMRADGSCVFLDENGLCRIHKEFGAEAKPRACQVFPFSFRPSLQGQHVSLRFDCPSAARSWGKPISEYGGWLGDLAGKLGTSQRPARSDECARWPRGLTATGDEIEALVGRVERWLRNEEVPVVRRFVAAARIMETLSQAKIKNVRGARFAELLDILFGSATTDFCDAPTPPSTRQTAMLRQLTFAHCERVSAELAGARWSLAALRRRWRQLQLAKRFRVGTGVVPRLVSTDNDVTFDEIEHVQPAAPSNEPGDAQDQTGSMLVRYCLGRLRSESCFGAGYYGWPILTGLSALWMSMAVTGWLARYVAACAGRSRFEYDDAVVAIGLVDRAATRLPALGALAEKTRLAFLRTDDGVARLIHHYALGDVERKS
jgi:lysine-N-methylase